MQRTAVERERTRGRAQCIVCGHRQRALRNGRTAGIRVAARHGQGTRAGLLNRTGPADGTRVGAGAVLLEAHEPVVSHGQRQVRRIRLQRRASVDGGNDGGCGRAKRARQIERAALYQRG